MNIKYLFNSDTDYMNFFIDTDKKTVTGKYVRANFVMVEKTIDVSPILSIVSASLPQVELAKRGNVWDFHLSVKDPFGESFRKTLSILADDSFHPTEVEFNNPSTTDRILKDLISYPLSVYNSPVQVIGRRFDVLDYVSGKSSATSLSPVLKNAGLLIGAEASLYITLAGGDIPLDQSMYIAWKFKELPNLSSSTKITEFKIGANTVTYQGPSLLINGTLVKNLFDVTADNRFVIVTNPLGDDAKVLINGNAYDCTFYSGTPVGKIHITSDKIQDEYILEDFVIQASENYFLDSTPPPVVTHLNAIPKDKEIFVNWQKSDAEDIAGYNVYVNGRVHNIDTIIENNYQITGLANSVEYLVTVTSLDKSGNESVSAEALTLSTLSDPSVEISNLRIDTSEAGVHLQFTPPTYSGINKIRVYRESLSNLGQQLLVELAHDATEYLDAPKPIDGRYIYLITTVSLGGDETNGTKSYFNVI